MDIKRSFLKQRAKIQKKIDRLQKVVQRMDDLLPLLGKSAAIVGDSFDGEYDIVQVGDEVYSKYLEEGVIIDIENPDHEHWFEVRIVFKDKDGKIYKRSADRMNFLG
jgi:hypothetical protein